MQASKEELLELLERMPEDPTEAYIFLCREMSSVDFSQSDSQFDIMSEDVLVQVANRYNLQIPPKVHPESTFDYVKRLISFGTRIGDKKDISDLLDRYDVNRSSSEFGFAYFSDVEKEFLRTRLSEVRNTILSSNLKESKKSALLKRIQKLEEEIELQRTPTERFFSFMADLAFVSGDMATKAKPAIDEFKDILRIVMRSRAKVESVSLSESEQWPQLPEPEDLRNE